MKKKLTKLMLVMVAITGIVFLHSCEEKQEEGFTNEKMPFNKAVDYKLARGCAEKYKSTSLMLVKKTEIVKFDKEALTKWMISLNDIEYDKMEITFGIYTKDFLNTYRDAEDRRRRVTVFLFPTNKGEPAIRLVKLKEKVDTVKVDPFNMGEVHP